MSHLLQLHHFLSLHQDSLNLCVQLPTLFLHSIVFLPAATQTLHQHQHQPQKCQLHKAHVYINHTVLTPTSRSMTQTVHQHQGQSHRPYTNFKVNHRPYTNIKVNHTDLTPASRSTTQTSHQGQSHRPYIYIQAKHTDLTFTLRSITQTLHLH